MISCGVLVYLKVILRDVADRIPMRDLFQTRAALLRRIIFMLLIYEDAGLRTFVGDRHRLRL